MINMVVGICISLMLLPIALLIGYKLSAVVIRDIYGK